MLKHGIKQIEKLEVRPTDGGPPWIIPIRMVPPGIWSRDAGTSFNETHFVATFGEPAKCYKHKSIDALRKQLREVAAAQQTAQWKKVLLIKTQTAIEPMRRAEKLEDWERRRGRRAKPEMNDDGTAELAIKVGLWEIAEPNGKRISRAASRETHVMNWWPTDPKHESRRWDDEGAIWSMLDDTPENRAAIDAVIAIMKLAADKLRALMKQDQIVPTLLSALRGNSLPLLPAPQSDKQGTACSPPSAAPSRSSTA